MSSLKYKNISVSINKKQYNEYLNKYFVPEIIAEGIWLIHNKYSHIPGYYLAYWKVWSNIEQNITVIVGIKNATTGEVLYSVEGTLHVEEGTNSNFTWFYIDKEGEMIPFLNIIGFQNDTYIQNNYIEGSNLTFIKPFNIGLGLVVEVYDWGNDKFVYYPNKTIFVVHVFISSDINKTGLNIPVNISISYYDLLKGKNVVIPYNFVVHKVIDGFRIFNFTFKAPYTKFVNIYGRVKWLREYGDDPVDNIRNVTLEMDEHFILLNYSKIPKVVREGDVITIKARYWNNLVDLPESMMEIGVRTIIDNSIVSNNEYKIKPGVSNLDIRVKIPENPSKTIIPYIWSVKKQNVLRNVTIDIIATDSYFGDEDINFKVRVISNGNVNNISIYTILTIIII
ncbi:MAG: hypothetical protein J7K23_07215, partial [Thermoproteales archaeon]|nr:hypothetical protein [Thermoproteales archaeon]